MRVLSQIVARLFGLYGFGARTLRRRAGPVHIGYGLDQRRFG